MCGKEAKLNFFLDENNGAMGYYVGCSSCCIRSNACSSKQSAVKMWNKLPNVKAERDWLAYKLEDGLACNPPKNAAYCEKHSCSECKYSSKAAWLKSAREATCQKS